MDAVHGRSTQSLAGIQMGIVATAFIAGFALAHVIAYLHISAVLAPLEASAGVEPLLAAPPSAWYFTLSIFESVAAATAFIALARRRFAPGDRLAWVFGASLSGAVTSGVGVGFARPFPPFVQEPLQLVADLAIAVVLGGLFGYFVAITIARVRRNAS
jgi:hypothetical protein